MKRILFALLMLFAATNSLAQSTASSVRLQQHTADDLGFVGREMYVPPAGKDGIFFFSGTTKLPSYITLGTGLSITDGVLSVDAAGVNADWTATSGPSRILNKPTISTVGMTGQYGDLLGKPANVSDFANDAGYVTGSSLTSALSGYALASSVTSLASVARSGNYNDLTNKPTIPTVTPFNFGDPNARSLSLSTAYQANDPTKAAIITVSTSCTASLSLTAGGTCAMQIRTSPGLVSCASGLVYATLTNANTGTLTVGLGLNQRVGSATTINLRAGSYFILCPTNGTFTIDSAVDQSAG